MKTLKKALIAGVVSVLSAAVSTVAFAQTEGPGLADGATTAISGISGDLTTVGIAVIGLAVVAMGISWIKATFF